MPAPELIRASILHVTGNPWRDAQALVAHDDGGLLIEGGRIAACGPFDLVRTQAPTAPLTDWRGGYLLPGFIDTHVHFPQLRIIGQSRQPLLDWLEHVALPEEARMAEPACAVDTARRFVRALAAHGTTTASVFGAHFPQAVAALFQAAETAGLRIASGLVVSDRGLGAALHMRPEEAYDHSVDLIDRFHGRGLLRYAVTPRFAVSTSEAMLEVCQALLDAFPGVSVQTHINEHGNEIDAVARLFPWAPDYLSVYERYGLVGRRTILAHNVHARPAEIERVAASRAAIAHCPSSNAALGSGVFPLARHLAAGVRVALGTDVGAGLGFSLMREATHARLVQNLAATPAMLEAAHMLYLATLAGAEAMGLEAETGNFAPGKSADFVLLQVAPDGVLASALEHASDTSAVVSALFTLAGPEMIREVRVANRVVFRFSHTLEGRPRRRRSS